ncbi:iron-containing alcohol dehydrogenase [Sinirhodobacter populi]|uniref:Glycerol dehydrogenase n=1 Tax=Paenirhodobacter populi TaxID=2306993 RepID=A0A443K7N2_9RHOB|nr:iron-containing alcohol dehydrogenase [Sinirhodobacter populi]RWR28746.1 iron-containing alcohol dehydrogenase [Sinirhodobacter populi]
MFDTTVAVFGAPGRYVQGPGSIRLVGDCAASLGDAAVLVVDAMVREMVADHVAPACAAAGVDLAVLPFAGQLGAATAADLLARLDGRVRTVIAAGGGRAIDAGKALAERIGGGLITLPTVASNDAPTSKNFVLYDDHHRLLEVRHLPRNPDFVIVDTAILSRAPRALFRAGLGDAIAKKFEAEACMAAQGANMFAARPTRLACAIAQSCHDQLVRHAAAAWQVAGTGTVTEDFEAAVEAMILMAGLGFESGGLSLPHAMTRGIPLLPGAAEVPHGLQVAWALLIHFRVIGRHPPAELIELYRATGLPLTLADLGVTAPSDRDLAAMARASLAARHARNMPFAVDEAMLVAAVRANEAGLGLPVVTAGE